MAVEFKGMTQMDREKLLKERSVLVQKIEELKKRGPSGKSAAALTFHQEDLTALAKKVISIDKKLGRI